MTRLRLKRDHLRPLLSETAPYEVPLAFTLGPLHKFLTKIGFELVEDGRFLIRNGSCANSRHSSGCRHLGSVEREVLEGVLGSKFSQIDSNSQWCKYKIHEGLVRHPLKYLVDRPGREPRELSLPHPASMIELSDFIYRSSDDVLYFCARSRFSLRRPIAHASMKVRKDAIFSELSSAPKRIEYWGHEYSRVSTYFAYHRYTNISQFYSSGEFAYLERKFPLLLRLDVANCFDSIYTHTISWATNGVYSSKNYMKETAGTFGGRFDGATMRSNYNETAGIGIGPESSRVFAEVILQAVDVAVERSLKIDGFVFGVDYEVLRYVDDYFVFAATSENADVVRDRISRELRKYKLLVNDSKTVVEQTPSMGSLSLAKKLVRSAIDECFWFDHNNDGGEIADIDFKSDRFLSLYRDALVSLRVDERDVAGYVFNALSRRLEKCLIDPNGMLRGVNYEKSDHFDFAHLCRSLQGLVRVAATLFSTVSSSPLSFRFCRIVALCAKFLASDPPSRFRFMHSMDYFRKEILTQMSRLSGGKGVTLSQVNLLDCFVYLNDGASKSAFRALGDFGSDEFLQELNAVVILSLIRSCGDEFAEIKSLLVDHCASLVREGTQIRLWRPTSPCCAPHCQFVSF